VENEVGDDHEVHVGTDLARRALARPDALTPTLAPRVTRSLARFRDAAAFNQPLNKWNTRSVTNMYYMWVLTSPAVRSLAPRVTRSLARFEGATDFNQALNSWDVNSVNGQNTCLNFCLNAGFNNNPTSRIPSFPETCGTPGC